jgi:hypothetical protein
MNAHCTTPDILSKQKDCKLKIMTLVLYYSFYFSL